MKSFAKLSILGIGLASFGCGGNTTDSSSVPSPLGSRESRSMDPAGKQSSGTRSFDSGQYRNLFKEIGKSDAEIQAKVNAAYKQLFEGDPKSQSVYYPVGTDMAYIKDIGNNDVRSEGISYGLMITVQMDKKKQFDSIWRWAKKHMQHQSGPWKGYFAWQCDENGNKKSKFPASDGEEYIVTALFFAANRWGSSGEINYAKEANAILHTMLHKEKDNGGVVDSAMNMFNAKAKQVVFVPNGEAAGFTDPSYHLPAFYELWSRWADEDQSFWRDAATSSREFLKKAGHPKTGLFPDCATFDGVGKKLPWDKNNHSNDFLFDAFRVAGNIATDHAWFGKDESQVEQLNRLLDFFAAQKPGYVGNYTLEGKPLVNFKPAGLIAMNASAGIAATTKNASTFVHDLWNAQVPNGQWRYYDGLLYMFGMLQCSGQYRIWLPKK